MTWEPQRPAAWSRWEYHGRLRGADNVDKHMWTRGRLLVLSSVGLIEYRGEHVWQWLVSISYLKTQQRDAGRRVPLEEARHALRAFDMSTAEEDNHQPGVARMFFRICGTPADQPSECECKVDEDVVVEPDGFTWSKEKHANAEEARRDGEAFRRAMRL